MKTNVIYNEECLQGMSKLPDRSVDCVLSDLPYGTTSNAWDTLIPFEPLWAQYKRLLKPGGVVVLTAQAPFDKILAQSNMKWLRYEWIWEKTIATGHLNANRAPLKAHETILIFCEKQPSYRPQ